MTEKLRDPRFPAFHPRNQSREPIEGLAEHLLKKGDNVKAGQVLAAKDVPADSRPGSKSKAK